MAKQDNKTFTVAGIATNPDGTTKVRFANDLVARIKILNKANCTDIHMYNLPHPMTKIEAMKWMQQEKNLSGDASYALANRLADKIKAVKKNEMSVTLKTGSVTTPESSWEKVTV